MNNLNNNYHVAVPTAFNSDESLNVEATFQHILNLYEKGIRSILICGSTGEQHSLSLSEKRCLVESIEQENRFPSDLELIFGVASIRLAEAVELAQVVSQSKKIAAVLLGYPPYLIPTQEEAYYYTQTVLKEIQNKAVILYNNPRRTGFDLALKTILKLLENKNIIGIKEAGDKQKVVQLVAKSPKELFIFAGGDLDLEDKISLGFNSLSSIAGNIYPLEISTYFNALHTRSKMPQNSLDEMAIKLATVFTESPLPHLKERITKTEGINMGRCRLPLGAT